MALGNFAACLPTVLGNEGGLSMIRTDPGNWTGGRVGVGELKGTNMGIAASAHPDLDITHLSHAEAASIYEREYWEPSGCEGLPPGLDLSHLDATVNSGLRNSTAWLRSTSAGETPARIRAYATARLHSLESWRIWMTFGRGLAERVARTEARSIAMAAGDGAHDAIALAAVDATRTTRVHALTAHASTATSGVAASLGLTTGHPILGAALCLAFGASSVWNAFRASMSGARVAGLGTQTPP